MNKTKYIEADNDLQELKSQYVDLKECVDNQPIVTPVLIQTAIKSQVKTVNSIIRKCTFACVVAILLWLCIGGIFKLSLAFTIFTCLFMTADTMADNWTFWPLRKLFTPTTTLLDAARMVAKSNRRLKACFITAVIILIPWIAWLIWELVNSPVSGIETASDFTLLLIISAAIGMIIGLIIVTKIIRKLQSNLSEIDKNIKECLSDTEDGK